MPGQGIALAGPRGGEEAAAASASPDEPTFTVTVAKGDTLSQIAEKFAVTQKDIVALNRLPNPHHIEVGQVLKLPGEPPKPSPTPTSAPSPPPSPSPTPKAAPKQLQVRTE